MPHHTPEQRAMYAAHLHELIRTWVEEGEAYFEMELKRGVEWCRDARTQERLPRANPTLTLTLRINGGAEESEGPPVIPVPNGFLGPEV